MKLLVLWIALSFAAKQNQNVAESDGNCGEKLNENDAGTIFVKIEEDEYAKIKVTESYCLSIENIRRVRPVILRKKKAHSTLG